MSKRNRFPGVASYSTRYGKRWKFTIPLSPDPETGKRRELRKRGYLTQEEAAEAQREARYGKKFKTNAATPLTEYLNAWLESLVEVAPSTRRSYTNYMRWYQEAFGSVPLGEVDALMIERTNADKQRAGLSAVCVRKATSILKQALQRAVLHELIAANPCDRVRMPNAAKHQPKTWTQAEMITFLGKHGSDSEWGDYWQTMCETWMRVGEINDLRWSDIDFTERTITVSHAVFRNDNLKPVSGPVKTLRSNRVIAISAHLCEAFRARRERVGASAQSALVFPSPRANQWLTSQAVGRVLNRACRSAGVQVISPHEIRHSGGSIAYRAGIDIKTISERLGHTNVRFSLSQYVHIDERHHRIMGDAIGDILHPQGVKDGVNLRLVG